MNETEILQGIAQYKFYHRIQLTDTITTPGWADAVPAQNLCLKYLSSLDIAAKDVLDIGCRDGLFSFQAERMGAAKVVGIDNDLSRPATEFLIPFFKSRVQMRQLNLYDLRPDTFGLFDVVIFPGVLYHLRYPFWGLKSIRDAMKIGGHLLIETGIWLGEPDKAMLFCPIGKESPYKDDSTSCTFFNEKGLVDTVASLGFDTVAIEYLTESRGKGKSMWNVKQQIKSTLRRRGFTQSTTATDRCLFHLIYRGYDEESFETKYWETQHDFHTVNG